ncbi:hypothetical protein ZYGR_0Y00260 [Zygosaccharomyces rouxii]|uniref:alcohol oxidase n=1 Tax=Zygosaccharomyces rouxii TaxID=4956 RepID=A0A1Q3A4E0_ZYGRO|nr:hypothetical protein ZYGR_0Y00260 [Zygosaccharomyces rouxii]
MADYEYDFIVLGGGTAGNVVAGRLAENPDVRILVVEAGVGNTLEIEDIKTPSSAMELRDSLYDWAYKTTMVKREDYERTEKPNTRGKALGGSSSLNYFSWIPGCRSTFDRWEEFGGEEWTWDPLVPYLRKSVTYHDDLKLYPEELKKIGSGGPLPISHAELEKKLVPFREKVIEACKSRDLPVNENTFDGDMIGLTHCVNSIYHGVRSSSVYFVKDKSNITILTHVHSKKIIIDPADKVTKGVTIIKLSGEEHSYYAKREVIVAQGVFESPKLLMLSGVGPKKELETHGIDVIVENPHVGQHLLDHPGVPFVLHVKDGFGMDDHLLHEGPAHTAAVEQYKKDSTGPVGFGLFELIGFPRIDHYLEKDPHYSQTKKANGDKDPFAPKGQPHFELDFVSMFGSAFQWHYPTPKKGAYTSVVVNLVRPHSKPGEVRLNSTDPLLQPYINLNFFADELDIIAMREGIRFSYDILTKGKGFKDIVPQRVSMGNATR